MIRYTVVWHEDAQDTLAQIWLEAEDRNQISAAAASIDRALGLDADQKGGPVGDQLRVLQRPPLEILFEVDVLDRMAKVVFVRRRNI